MDAQLEAWSAEQSAAERADPIWTLLAYRLARFALDNARADLRDIERKADFRTRDQLKRAVTSISANIGEGYARLGQRERSHYYTIALGSTRETISWYTSLADELPAHVANARIEVLGRVRKLLLGLIKRSPHPRWNRERES